jgi:hypothetical protein
MRNWVGLGWVCATVAACSVSASPAPMERADGSLTPPIDSGAPTEVTDAAPSWSPALDGASDASEPDGGACPVVTPAPQPQVVSGELAQVTSDCSVDGGALAPVGVVPGTTTIEFDIGLPTRNQAEQAAYAQALYDPSSPLYRHFLTPAEYTAMYAPTECDYQALVDWAEGKGFAIIGTFSGRDLLGVSAPVATANAALHVTFNYYLRPDGTRFWAPDRDPSIDFGLPVLNFVGLDNCLIPMPVSSGPG